MNSINAIYARQSIDKKDSISIETQIQHCRILCGNDFKIYKDAGYSGSNTDRPDFKRLIEDVAAGKIKKVVSYRLDRISRSLTDFAKLIEMFNKHNVEFISATEQFDTGSPVGRAMVYIIMVFAQLERETIAARIRDNYFARAEKGMFLGGGCPIGYQNVRTQIEGKDSSILEIDIEASGTIKDIFTRYAHSSEALHNIAVTLPGKWTSNKIRRIIKNPAYVENSPEIYEFYKTQGYGISNDIEEFNGQNGCMLVGKEKGGKKNRILTDVSEQTLIIGLHEPIIDTYTFIQAQRKLAKNKATKRSGTSDFTWLTGLTKCNHCGHAVTVKRMVKRSKEFLYLVCRGRSNYGENICNNHSHHKLREVEPIIEADLLNAISNLNFKDIEDAHTKPEDSKIKVEIIKIDEKINNLINQLSEGIVAQYIKDKIVELDALKKQLQQQLNSSCTDTNFKALFELKDTIRERWEKSNTKERHMIAELAINRIRLAENGEIHIDWKV